MNILWCIFCGPNVEKCPSIPSFGVPNKIPHNVTLRCVKQDISLSLLVRRVYRLRCIYCVSTVKLLTSSSKGQCAAIGFLKTSGMDGIRTSEHPLRYPKKRTVPMMEIRQHLHDITHPSSFRLTTNRAGRLHEVSPRCVHTGGPTYQYMNRNLYISMSVRLYFRSNESSTRLESFTSYSRRSFSIFLTVSSG